MEAITPRWEWRTFGTSFGPAEDAFARLTPERIQESDEIYLVARDGDTVKVRDELMDIKVLREVDANGLEQWTPVMKAEFPVSAADVGRVFEALRQPVPALDRAEYTLDQFLDELIAPAEGGRRGPRPQAPGPLHDRRLHLRGDRCRRRRARDPHDRHRGRGSRRGDRRGPRCRPRWVRQHAVRGRAQRAPRRRAAALRGHRRRDELGQVPRRRARPGRVVAPGDRSGRADAARRGHRGDRGDRDRRDRSDRGRDRGHGRRGEAGRRARHRRRRDRRAAHRAEQRRGRGRDPAPGRRRRRGGLRRGGEPPGVPRGQGRASASRTGPWWCSTPVAAAASSRSGPATASTSGSASTSGRCATPSASGWTASCSPRRSTRRWRRSRPTSPGSTAGRIPTRWSGWAARSRT